MKWKQYIKFHINKHYLLKILMPIEKWYWSLSK